MRFIGFFSADLVSTASVRECFNSWYLL